MRNPWLTAVSLPSVGACGYTALHSPCSVSVVFQKPKYFLRLRLLQISQCQDQRKSSPKVRELE